MRTGLKLRTLIVSLSVLAFTVAAAKAQEKSAGASAEVHVVITDSGAQADSEIPRLKQDEVRVKQGKTNLQVTQLIPAQGDNAALQLMILIDDTLNTQAVGNNLTDLKEFIKTQPATTLIGVAYMSNAGASIAQNFTNDHDAAANAVRLPRGTFSTMDSPYLSLISLVKAWPQQKVRREVLIVSDGLDRLRGNQPTSAQLGPNYGPTYHSLPQISVDATSASEISQRYNVLVYSIYSPGIGRAGRSQMDLLTGLSGLSKIAEETGGETYSLGTTNAVSFKPYLEQFQKSLDNQYYLVFRATPKKKAGLQRVKIETELPKSEILAPDNVWVPAGGAQ
jgi:hypothetical protein